MTNHNQDWQQCAPSVLQRLSSLEQANTFLLGKIQEMSAEFDKAQADVTQLQNLAQSTADGLVAAQTEIAALKAQIAAGNTDTAGLVAMATSVEATLANVAKELPAPTPPTP